MQKKKYGKEEQTEIFKKKCKRRVDDGKKKSRKRGKEKNRSTEEKKDNDKEDKPRI